MAAGGLSVAVAVAVAAPLVFIGLLVNSFGVFDDWDPNAGFQTLRGYDGQLYKVPNSIFDQMAVDGNDNVFRAWIDQQHYKAEAAASAKTQIQTETLTQTQKQAVARKSLANAGNQYN